MRIYENQGFWYVYGDCTFGYSTPGMLKLVTRSEAKARRFIKKWS